MTDTLDELRTQFGKAWAEFQKREVPFQPRTGTRNQLLVSLTAFYFKGRKGRLIDTLRNHADELTQLMKARDELSLFVAYVVHVLWIFNPELNQVALQVIDESLSPNRIASLHDCRRAVSQARTAFERSGHRLSEPIDEYRPALAVAVSNAFGSADNFVQLMKSPAGSLWLLELMEEPTNGPFVAATCVWFGDHASPALISAAGYVLLAD